MVSTALFRVIDEGWRRLVAAVEADEENADNTVFVVVPDCGRESNPFAAVACPHHLGSRTSHEIFALIFGSGVPRGQVVDRRFDQLGIAATIGQFMGFEAVFAEGPVLSEAIS